MNTKRFSLPFLKAWLSIIGLALLAMLMMPANDGMGTNVAHAQGPDVGAESVSNLKLSLGTIVTTTVANGSSLGSSTMDVAVGQQSLMTLFAQQIAVGVTNSTTQDLGLNIVEDVTIVFDPNLVSIDITPGTFQVRQPIANLTTATFSLPTAPAVLAPCLNPILPCTIPVSATTLITVPHTGITTSNEFAGYDVRILNVTKEQGRLKFTLDIANVTAPNALTVAPDSLDLAPIVTPTVRFPNYPLAQLSVTPLRPGSAAVRFEFANADARDLTNTNGQSLKGVPNFQDGSLNIIRAQTYIRLDAPTCSNRDLPLKQISTGLTNTVVSLTADWISGATFELKYDPAILEVVSANSTGMAGSVDASIAGLIRYEGRLNTPASFNNQSILEVTWKGIKAGSALPSLQLPVLLDENGKAINTPSVQFGDRTSGIIGPTCDTISVLPLAKQLWFEPGSFTPVTLACDTVQQVRIQGVDNLNRVEIHVQYDPNQLEVIDQDLTQAGAQVKVGSAFKSNPSNYVQNANLAANGQIDFALTLNQNEFINSAGSAQNLAEIHWNKLPGATAGAAATIKFSAVALQSVENGNQVVQVPVTSYDSILSTIGSGTCNSTGGTSTPTPASGTPTATPTTGSGTPTSTPITGTTPTATPVSGTTPTSTPVSGTTPTATPVSGTTPTATPVSGDTITGRVRLQGRTSHTDFKVYADVTPCNLMTAGSSNEVAVTPTNNGTNDATFTLQNKGYQCLMVIRQGHLSAQRNSPAGNLGFIELPGGDFTASGAANVINIFDLSYAGSKFGATDALADFNGDGKVDIFDLAIVAGNYGRTGPMSW